MLAAQLDRPHIFVRPLDSIFLYNHPLLATKFWPNCVRLGASTPSADRSDCTTAAPQQRKGIFPPSERTSRNTGAYIHPENSTLLYSMLQNMFSMIYRQIDSMKLYKILAGAYHRMSLKLRQSYVVRSFGLVPKELRYRFFCSLMNQRKLVAEPNPTRRGEGSLSSMNN